MRKFSFITCTFNRADALKETLASICAQDFDKNQYEILVIDNNSTDNTSSIIEWYIKECPEQRICSIKESKQGLSNALNRGIREAEGEFLIYVDDDETINANHLTKLSEYLHQYPDAVLIGSPVIPIYEGVEPKWMSHFTQRLIGGYFNEGNQVKKLDKSKYPGTGHTIIKRELYNEFGLYNTTLGRTGKSLIGAEDKDMFYRLQKGGIECYYFPEIPIYHHITKEKQTDQFFDKLTYSIGVSEQIRTKSISKCTYAKRVFDEFVKWGASILLFFFYLLKLQPQKGSRLLRFRFNVTKGLFSKQK